MEKHLKMSELFTGKVSQSGSSISDATGIIGKLYGPDVYAKFAAHAINSHDELVAMNKELLAALECAEGFVCEVSEKTGFGQFHTLKVIRSATAKAKGTAS